MVTTRGVVAALLRRWYLVLAGSVLLVGAMLLELRAPGVYWTRFDLELVQPAGVNINSLRISQVDLSSTASLLAVDFNGAKGAQTPVDPDLTIVDEGVRQGYAVRSLDYGGQWSRSFRPMVNVQIVDPSRARVAAQVHSISARLEQLLAQRQERARIPQQERVVATVVPEWPGIGYRTGSRIRTAAGTAVAGGAVLGALVVGYDGWALRRRARLSPPRSRR